jgi:hypothetical protein
MRKLLIGILLSHVCISYAQIISTNIENGNQYINSSSSSFSIVYTYYGRFGKTNEITLRNGEEMLIHGVNITPISQNASLAFIRKKMPSGQVFAIGSSATNAGFSSNWTGPIVGPAIIEYGLDPANASYSISAGQFGWTPTNDIGSFLKTSCDFLLEIKDSGLSTTNLNSSKISSTSVVVPSNAIGDVDVLLEQSNDMITWTQCLPGTYNASTQKRFFRVRAVEK